MSVNTRLSKDDLLLVISIDGKFDFSLLDEFRAAYTDYANKSLKFIIDMRNTSTIDSSALGMLLNMQRHLKSPDGDISIINCNHVVGKVFKITNFNRKFTIE